MSLYKRGTIYWCKWTVSKKEIRETTGTADHKAAQEYHDRRRAEIWREAKLGDVRIATWEESTLQWVEEHAIHKASYETDRVRLIWLNERLTGKPITHITTDILLGIRKELMESRAASTANRFLAIVSAVLNYAHAKGLLAGVPKIPYLPENNDRFIWITREQANKFTAALPDHLSAMVRFTLCTGLRRANVTGLMWENIDIDRKVAWVWPDEAKAGKAIPVPLNADAIALLKEQAEKKKKRKNITIADARYVFTFRGKKIERTTTKAWYEATTAVGIDPEFTFHGLRHTWASWHVMSGTPLTVLKELGGWASLDMVMKYAHLAPGYVANYAENITSAAHARGYNSGYSGEDVSEDYREDASKLGWLMGLEPTTTGITILKRKKKAA
jgi:integrase